MSKVHSTYLAQTVICILLLLAMGITASSIGLQLHPGGRPGRQAPFDITVQNQNADSAGRWTLTAELNAAGFDPDKLAWQQDFLIYYKDPPSPGSRTPASIRLSDYNALLAGARGEVTTPAPARLWSPGRRYAAWSPAAWAWTWWWSHDTVLDQLEVRRQVWVADYAGDAEETEANLVSAPGPELPQTSSSRTESRIMLYQELVGNKILALFLGLYLGFTFLLAAAAVLALQQLSQGADNAGRYAILRRLGAQESMVSRCAVEQVALAFLLPLALALIHSVVGMKAANDFIAQAGKVDALQSTAVTALMLLVVYGGYFLATALACRRLALQGTERGAESIKIAHWPPGPMGKILGKISSVQAGGEWL